MRCVTSRVRPRAAPGTWPIVLRSGDGRARVRPWWHDPTIAQLTFVDHGVVPSSTALRVWLGELQARGFAAVRTGAVTDAGTDMLRRQGFEVIQTLRLLDASLVGWRPPPGHHDRTRRLRERERMDAAAVDVAAFGAMWAIDEAGIDETCEATPAHRARAVDDPDHRGEVAGYAISGRADHTGYLQRLAVHPNHQGHGFGSSLIRDSLVWMQRRRLTRAVVNTHTDNTGALSLYHRFGFRDLPQGLSVLNRRLDDV